SACGPTGCPRRPRPPRPPDPGGLRGQEHPDRPGGRRPGHPGRDRRDRCSTASAGRRELMRNLLSTTDLSQAEALAILDAARELAQVADRPVKKLPTLRG